MRGTEKRQSENIHAVTGDRGLAPADSGAFRFRLATCADVARCGELLPGGFRAPAAVRQQLPNLWSRILASDARVFTVIEDVEKQHPGNIEGFGLSIFVSDRFLDGFWAAPRPYLAAQCYERMLAGEDFMLNSEQVRRANSSGGVNIVVLHFGVGNEDLSDSRTAQVLLAGAAAFYFFHSGYRLKAIANEVYGEQSARHMERGGFRLERDFQRESPTDFEGMAPHQYPYLFSLRQEWAEPAIVNPPSQLFFHPVPRIHFSNAERRVLEGALLNESDLQIAERLGVSVDSVKKTWRNIYTRASRQMPNLVPRTEFELTGSRGQEKRRHILDYVRGHLEELRPSVDRGSRSNRGTMRKPRLWNQAGADH